MMTKLRRSYDTMLKSVQRFKLTATKTDKLWVLFHRFSLKEGYEICKECDFALCLKAHKTFWQLLLEKQKEEKKLMSASNSALVFSP